MPLAAPLPEKSILKPHSAKLFPSGGFSVVLTTLGKICAHFATAFMMVHLIDGTYELFRHFYGLRSFKPGKDKPLEQWLVY